MGATIDIGRKPILRDLIRDGQAAQVDRWAKKLLTADTLEGVLRKK